MLQARLLFIQPLLSKQPDERYMKSRQSVAGCIRVGPESVTMRSTRLPRVAGRDLRHKKYGRNENQVKKVAQDRR